MLELRALSKTFGRLTAVDGLDLNVSAGEIHGLIGPNGSGKSTTMNLISGALAPSSGQVLLEGVSVGGKPTHRIARLGLVRTFQLTRIFSAGTVFEAVRLGAMASRGRAWQPARWLPFKQDTAEAETARSTLARMGLEDHADAKAASLPGGLQRILSMATAVATGPRMILFDEPLAGLNASEKAEVVDRIEGLRESGITILIVEHDVRSVMRLCDRITVIDFGRKIATGAPSEISRDETVIKAYLGHRRH